VRLFTYANILSKILQVLIFAAESHMGHINKEHPWNNISFIWQNRIDHLAFQRVHFPQLSDHAKISILYWQYNIMIIKYAVYHMHLRCVIIWSTTSNHCDRSGGNCTMTISSLSQVSNILPISVFVFGDCWCSVRWTTCIAANDQDTFICWSRCIWYYSEN